MSEIIVGIDLGTTNSAIAVVKDGEVVVLPVHGQSTMPSAVGLDSAGRLLVGQAAKNQLISAPEATLTSVKRQMGESATLRLGERTLSPEEVSAMILGELKKEAEKQLGQAVRKAVITVPAFFNERQRKATQLAGELAGLEVVRIINEPTAAALAYGASQGEGETMLVYDLGGGTFDVSLVKVEGGVVEVKASHGDTHLGGDDFDEALVRLAEKRFQEAHPGGAAFTDLAQRRLKGVLEKAKIQLSDDPYVQVREEYVTPEHHLDTEILRSEYEQLIHPWLEKTLECLHRTLRDADLTSRQIDKLMLVGGATRTPAVSALLQDRLGLEPRFEIDPDLIVAMGAAVQGSIIAGQPAKAILIDITPHTYSMETLAEHSMFMPIMQCVPIIPRNTPLPCRKADVFTTIADNQKQVDIRVFQGESDEPEDNSLVGEFTINGLAPVPAGNKITVEFALDLNGMLKVTAQEKNTGLAKTVTLDTRGQHVLNVDKARKNLASIYEDDTAFAEATIVPEEENPAELLNTAKSLRRRADALLAKDISADDAGEIRQRLHQTSEAISARDFAAVHKASDALSDILFYLED